MSESQRLSGIRAKIERAKHHVDTLEKMIDVFRQSNPYSIIAKDDPNTGDKVFIGKLLRPIGDDLRCVVGDAFHNLRCAFDHLAWQLVEANGQTPRTKSERIIDPTTKGKITLQRTAFPFCKGSAEYKAQSPGIVQGMHPSAIKMIDSLQPYKGGNDDLWVIHELDIIDKHHLLLVCVTGYRNVQFISGATKAHIHKLSRMFNVVWPMVETAIRWAPGDRIPILIDGAEIIRVKKSAIRPDHPTVNDEVNLALSIAFAQPKVVEGKPVLPFLHQLCGLVDAIVNQFVPFL